MTENPALKLQGYLNGKPVPDEVVRALWPRRTMTLAESLAHMMAEYIVGARKLSPDIPIDQRALQSLFEARLARYISADKIALIISEDAQFQNGQLNTGFLAVKIAEVCEGKRDV
jgi:hypothetical protein